MSPPPTTTLFRPVGRKELDLIERSGFREFPPRLPGQPIFYPVLNRQYAEQIAREWNTRDASSGQAGFVTQFDVGTAYLARFEPKQVGGASHVEYWVPAEDLPEFNRNIHGPITVIAEFRGAGTLAPGLRPSWSLCETVRADLLATLRTIPSSLWARPPEAGRWNVAQQADHVLKAEVGTSKIVRRLIRGDFQGLTRPPDAPLYDSRLDVYPFGTVAAPAALQPDGLDADEAYQQLAAAHARFFEELTRFAADDPDALVAPDPASDLWFTLAGWVRVQALHEAHHTLQIKDAANASRARG